MKLSVVIPAYNESLNLPDTINALYLELVGNNIHHEILVINDNSKDNTDEIINELKKNIPTLNMALTNQ